MQTPSSASAAGSVEKLAAALAEVETFALPRDGLLKQATPQEALQAILAYAKSNPELAGALLGTLGGGAYGAATDLFRPEEERSPWQSSLSGALGGGLLGLAGGLGYKHLPKLRENMAAPPEAKAPKLTGQSANPFVPGATAAGPVADGSPPTSGAGAAATAGGMQLSDETKRRVTAAATGLLPVSKLTASEQQLFEQFVNSRGGLATSGISLPASKQPPGKSLLQQATEYLGFPDKSKVPVPQPIELPENAGPNTRAWAAARDQQAAQQYADATQAPSAKEVFYNALPFTGAGVAADVAANEGWAAYANRLRGSDLQRGVNASMDLKLLKDQPHPLAGLQQHLLDQRNADAAMRAMRSGREYVLPAASAAPVRSLADLTQHAAPVRNATESFSPSFLRSVTNEGFKLRMSPAEAAAKGYGRFNKPFEQQHNVAVTPKRLGLRAGAMLLPMALPSIFNMISGPDTLPDTSAIPNLPR